MEPNSEKQPSDILLEGKPKLSGAEVDKNRDAKRIVLVPFIEKFLSTDELFKGKEVAIKYSHEGVSSLVCFVEVKEEKFVLKIALNDTVTDGSESLFLKTWEAAGIKTPRVFKDGKIADSPYILMEYIDAPTVEAKCGDDESAKEKMYFEVGKILHEMHKPKSTGFGKAIDGKGEFASFKEWVDSADMAKRIKYVEDNNLINSELGNFAEARDVLVNFVGDSDMSSYCHFDYGAKHLFATEPLTVFDPNPLFNIGYIDLGRTLVNYIGASGTYPKQLVEGYGGADGFDEKVLRASIFLNIVYKMRYQHQKGKKEVVQNFKNYLANNKSFSV